LIETFLHQVHSIEVKVNSLDQDFDPIYEVLSCATNLRELSIVNDESEFLDSDVILEVIGVNSGLESLRLSGFEISTEQLIVRLCQPTFGLYKCRFAYL
jgi:hypothetical protein